MILVGTETQRSATQVLEEAVGYFGLQGVGLEVTQRSDTSVQLQGGGGYVAVRVQPVEDKGTLDVEIESREWERDAERFLEKI